MNDSKVIIITGGGKGIGAETARLLLTKNFRIVVVDKELKEKDRILQDEKRHLFIQADVSSELSVKKMVKKAINHFGRIDSLINNAGILPDEKLIPLEKITLKTWREYLNTNLTGAFLCSKYAVPYLRKNKGTIINIASTRALQSEGNDVSYAASKGGLVSLTHALSVNLSPSIRVNCISPGWIDTQKEKLRKTDHEQHLVGRVGQPQDIAHLISFLISDEASFITGQNFIADGGMTIKMIYL